MTLSRSVCSAQILGIVDRSRRGALRELAIAIRSNITWTLSQAPGSDRSWRTDRVVPTFLFTAGVSRSGWVTVHPFPVPLRVYDQTIRVLKSAVQKAKLGREEELQALKRLDEQARQLECVAAGSSLETLMIEEHANSHFYGGRTVFGKAPAAAITASPCRQALRRP